MPNSFARIFNFQGFGRFQSKADLIGINVDDGQHLIAHVQRIADGQFHFVFPHPQAPRFCSMLGAVSRRSVREYNVSPAIGEEAFDMRPLRFSPILKHIRWGGTRLGTQLGKSIGNARDCAESWELCDHGNDQSVVISGEFQGWTLSRLIREHGHDVLGRHAGVAQFPLLIKFLDACDRLSLQVHPTDELARQQSPPDNGKTEAWVIIAAEPGSRIYAGLLPSVDRAAFESALARGSIEECLHHFEVAAGDCIFISAGTVHAIGEGVLLAEVQQSSDITYRLHDWGRVGSDGKPRELHIAQALNCIDFARGPVGKITPKPLHESGHTVEELVRCDYFILRRHTGPQAFTLTDDQRCHVLSMLRGSTELQIDDADETMTVGETILVPASSLPLPMTLGTDAILLETYLP